MKPEIVIKDGASLAALAAERFAEQAQAAISTRGRFVAALAGGHTPEKMYALLAKPPYKDAISWDSTFLFMSDERCVAYDDERSNFGMASREMIAHVPLPKDHVFPIPTDQSSPNRCAAVYAQTLADFFGQSLQAAPPAFDLILLGLGDDGHTASLFPGMPTLHEQTAWVLSSPPGTLPPPVDRVTFTFPLLNAARQILFLVEGENKSEPVRDVLEGQAAVETRPAAGVQPTAGQLTWLLDSAAAALLSRPAL